MVEIAEQTYRERLAAGPLILAEALDSVIPVDSTQDDSATALVRELCFGVAHYKDREADPFSHQFPYMLDHGVRQVALAKVVLADAAIQEQLPGWFDQRSFAQTLIATDVGLAFVPALEVKFVHDRGPQLAWEYFKHPEYGFGMAEALGPTDDASRLIAFFIARHHAIQAKNQYGPSWVDLKLADRLGDFADEDVVDALVSFQKPFDYTDDVLSRKGGGGLWEARAAAPDDKFARSNSGFFVNNLQVTAFMWRTGMDTSLPFAISRAIKATLQDTRPNTIGEVYAKLHT